MFTIISPFAAADIEFVLHRRYMIDWPSGYFKNLEQNRAEHALGSILHCITKRKKHDRKTSTRYRISQHFSPVFFVFR
jgi:hypothetical protein